MLAVCGRFLTLISHIIMPAFSFNCVSSSRPPSAILVVCGRLLTVSSRFIAHAFCFNPFSSRYDGLTTWRLSGVGVGSEELHPRLMFHLVEPNFHGIQNVFQFGLIRAG